MRHPSKKNKKTLCLAGWYRVMQPIYTEQGTRGVRTMCNCIYNKPYAIYVCQIEIYVTCTKHSISYVSIMFLLCVY